MHDGFFPGQSVSRSSSSSGSWNEGSMPRNGRGNTRVCVYNGHGIDYGDMKY